MVCKIYEELCKLKTQNGLACAEGREEKSKETFYMATGLVHALRIMGCKVEMESYYIDGCRRITDIEATMGVHTPRTPAQEQPKQEREMPNTLYLFRPLAEFGEALKESCPPNDCVVYRNIYEMYCERLTDYKRILATCPDLAEGTVRVLESSIHGLIKQLHDMWETNIAVNRKREAMRSEKEHKARIAAQARE